MRATTPVPRIKKIPGASFLRLVTSDADNNVLHKGVRKNVAGYQ